jgi:hypothetical protein
VKSKTNLISKSSNREKCPIGGDHPPNGEEFALGCGICRINEETKF